MKPAEDIFRKCGGGSFAKGVNLVSAWTSVEKSRVYRWNHPRDKHGTDGVIPAQHQQKILDGARRAGVALAPEDFFARPGTPSVPPPEAAPKKGRRDDVIVVVSGVKTPFAYLNGEKVGLADVKRHIRDLERDAA